MAKDKPSPPAEASNQAAAALIGSWRGSYPPAAFSKVFVIGLAGLAGSGKTTVASELCGRLEQLVPGRRLLRLSFAGRIRAAMEALAGEQLRLDDQTQKNSLFYEGSQLTVREFMITFSFDFIQKQLGPNFWVDLVAHRLAGCRQPTIAIIDDVRLRSESELCQALGPTFLLRRQGSGADTSHISEQPAKLLISHEVDNDNDVRQTALAITALAKKHPRWP